MSLFSYYVYNRAQSDTDGANTFPADQYDLRREYGRAAIGMRHQFVLGVVTRSQARHFESIRDRPVRCSIQYHHWP